MRCARPSALFPRRSPATHVIARVRRAVIVSARGRGLERDAGLITASIQSHNLLASTGVARRNAKMTYRVLLLK